jgi:hypothetical protein
MNISIHIVLVLVCMMLVDGALREGGKKEYKEVGEKDYEGLYVDKFGEIAGNPSQEDDLLRWAQAHSFHSLTLYNMKAVLGNPGLKPALADFIRKARSQYGIAEVTAVVSNSSTVTTLIDAYNRSQRDPGARFDHINLELEWWNNACAFDQYSAYLQAMKEWGERQKPIVEVEEYIGWFKNPVGEDSLMAAALVRNSDRILVHDYQQNPTFTYLQPRLDWIGRAARAQGKTMPIIVIFNAKPEFMGGFFAGHSFSDAYHIVQDAWSHADFAGKGNLRLIGYQIYNQSAARVSKP